MKKYLPVLYSMITAFCLQAHVYGQTAGQISGTIKSKQGVIQGAQVEFYDLSNEFQGNCISGTNGKFTAEKKINLNRTLQVKINATGYKPLVKNLKVQTNGDAGEFMLERQDLIITGFVRDSVTEQALPGSEIFFYNEQGKLIQARSTNGLGYYEVETEFTYGQKITLRVTKKGYSDDKEQTLTFTSEGINKLSDILLPAAGDRGLRAFIRVRDKNSGKPLEGGTVRYFDKKLSSFVDAPIPANGELELRLFQRAGTALDIQVIKSKYRTVTLKAILSDEPLNNVFTCELVKGH